MTHLFSLENTLKKNLRNLNKYLFRYYQWDHLLIENKYLFDENKYLN